MTKKFLGGVICGAVVGAAIGMLADPISDRQHRKMKSCASHLFKTIGSVMDSVMENM